MKFTFHMFAALIAVAAAPPLSAQRLPVAHGDITSSFPILADPLTVTRTRPAEALFFTRTRGIMQGKEYSASIAADAEREKATSLLYNGSVYHGGDNLIAYASVAEQSGRFALTCAPNPCIGSTNIHFAVGSPKDMTIVILDESGREVARPLDGRRYDAGEHAIRLDASGFPSGRYFCAVSADGTTKVRKIVVVR